MTVEDAIKYLKQLYPNGGHCWLDEQRIEAIGMAINALQEEPVSRTSADIEAAMQEVKEKSEAFTDAHQGEDADTILAQMRGEEPVSEDLPHIRHRDTLDEFAYQCAYDLSNDWAKETPTWHDVEMACKLGSNWQKEQMMKDVMPCVLEWYDGFMLNFTEEQLNDVVTKNNINIGDKVKLIVIKED